MVTDIPDSRGFLTPYAICILEFGIAGTNSTAICSDVLKQVAENE